MKHFYKQNADFPLWPKLTLFTFADKSCAFWIVQESFCADAKRCVFLWERTFEKDFGAKIFFTLVPISKLINACTMAPASEGAAQNPWNMSPLTPVMDKKAELIITSGIYVHQLMVKSADIKNAKMEEMYGKKVGIQCTVAGLPYNQALHDQLWCSTATGGGVYTGKSLFAKFKVFWALVTSGVLVAWNKTMNGQVSGKGLDELLQICRLLCWELALDARERAKVAAAKKKKPSAVKALAATAEGGPAVEEAGQAEEEQGPQEEELEEEAPMEMPRDAMPQGWYPGPWKMFVSRGPPADIDHPGTSWEGFTKESTSGPSQITDVGGDVQGGGASGNGGLARKSQRSEDQAEKSAERQRVRDSEHTKRQDFRDDKRAKVDLERVGRFEAVARLDRQGEEARAIRAEAGVDEANRIAASGLVAAKVRDETARQQVSLNNLQFMFENTADQTIKDSCMAEMARIHNELNRAGRD